MTAKTIGTSVCMRGVRQSFFFGVLAVIAAGCASRPVKYYVLDSGPTPQATAVTTVSPRFPITLLVARIASSHLYRDDRLVYGSGPVQLGTYEYQRWAEPPIELVQDSLIAALRATGEYRSVSAISSSLRGEYIVRGRLDALDEVDEPKVAARFAIELQLFDSRSGTTVWTDSYSHDEPVTGKTVPDVVEALDRNVHTGMQQLSANLIQYFVDKPPQAVSSR
jgi:ABC-type uncharacterized transport system auxiliary subunit